MSKSETTINGAQLSRSVESAGLGTWEWNIATGELVWSRECREMFGVAADREMTYEVFLEAVHPEDRERVDAAVKGAIKSGEEYSVEMRTVWPDGSLHWITSRGRVYYDKPGKPARMSGAAFDVTKLKMSEEALRMARADAKAQADNLAAILDAVPAVTLVSDDPECKRVRSSRFGYEIAGLPYGVNVSAAAPPGEHQGFQLTRDGHELKPEESPLREATRSGKEVRNRELELRLADGRVLHLFGHATPLFNESGEVRGAVGAFLDITALKNTEEQLRRARAETKAQAENFAAIFDAMPASAFFSQDRACTKMVSNRAAYEMLRMPYGTNTSKSAPEGEQLTFRIFENGRELTAEELPVQKAAATGQPVQGKELEIRFDDGSCIYEFGHAVPLFDEAGAVRGAVGAFLDITDRKVIEQRLRTATERFHVGLRNAPVTVFNQDLDLRYTWVHNPVGKHTTAEILGKTDHDLLEDPADADEIEKIKREVLRTGVSYKGEMTATFNGVRRYYHVNVDPQRDPRGNIVGLTCATFDLTERKMAEEALRASEARFRDLAENLDREVQARTRELQHRNEQVVVALDGLRRLSNRLLLIQDEERRRIARELHDSAGQILTALGLELAAIKEAARDEAKVKVLTDAAEELVQQLHREIRTTSYLLHPPLLDEAGLYSALSWYVQGIRQRSGIEVELEMESDFGRLPREMELVIFRLLQESLTNIHRHSGSKTALVRLKHDEQVVRLEVHDGGKGMGAERLAAIRSGGSGVGIRGMRERLHQLNGELRIESDTNGTRVFADIPITKEREEESGVEAVRAVG